MNHLPHVQYTGTQLVPPGDARKLSSVECAIGKSDSLISPLTGFMNRFKAKRIRNTSWHHSAQSGLNQRYSFTYVFRHNVRSPEHQQVLAPASNQIEGVATTEVNINSLEGVGLKGEWVQDLGIFTGGDNLVHWNQGVPDKTFYSPFCLQELEQLSWNINNFKLVPAKLGYSNHSFPTPGGPGYGSNATLDSDIQDQLNVDSFGISKQTQTNTDFTIPSPLDQFDFDFADAISSAGMSQSFTLLKNQAYQPVVRTGNGTALMDGVDMGSSFRRFNAKVGAQDALADYGKYKCQLGVGKLTFTFVNTGDTTMIVDMVVHKVKEDQSMYQLTPTNYNTMRFDGIPGDPSSPNDIHSGIVAPYKTNYEDYHNREQDRVMSTYIRKGEDVVSDPKVKFLPTSYRTPVRAQHKSSNTGEPMRTMQVTQPDGPVFVDIQRQHITVPSNSRKTIIVHLPARQYDPASYNYNCVLNELGYAVTFGITGKTTRVALPSEFQDTVGAVAARYMGRQAAPTSFHIYGHEMETVMPCALFEKEDYESNNARLAPLGTSSNLQSVVYNPPTNRQEEGRYAAMQIDNQGRGVSEVSETSLSVKRTADIMEDHQVKKVQKIDFTTQVYNIWRTLTDWHATYVAVQAKVAEVCNYYKSSIEYLNKHHELLWLAVQAGNTFKKLVNSLSVVKAAQGYLAMGAGLLDAVSNTVTIASIEQFLCDYTSVAPASTKQLEWLEDLSQTHDEPLTITGGRDGGLRRLTSQDVYLIGDGGISGIGDADKAAVERCLGFVKSFFPDALTITADMFINFTDENGQFLDYMANKGQPVSQYAPFTKGVHWDDGEGNIVPNMVAIDQNQDGVPDQPIIAALDQNEDGNPDLPIATGIRADEVDGTNHYFNLHHIISGGILEGDYQPISEFLSSWMTSGLHTNYAGINFSYPYLDATSIAAGYVDSSGRLMKFKLIHSTTSNPPFLWKANSGEISLHTDLGSNSHPAHTKVLSRLTDWITHL